MSQTRGWCNRFRRSEEEKGLGHVRVVKGKESKHVKEKKLG